MIDEVHLTFIDYKSSIILSIRPGDAFVYTADHPLREGAEAVPEPEARAGDIGSEVVEGATLVALLARPVHRVAQDGGAQPSAALAGGSDAVEQIHGAIGPRHLG